MKLSLAIRRIINSPVSLKEKTERMKKHVTPKNRKQLFHAIREYIISPKNYPFYDLRYKSEFVSRLLGPPPPKRYR